MPLLSKQDQPRPPRTLRPRRSARALPAIAIVENCVQARLGDALIAALPEGALWIASARTLIVSDLHLEKGSSFARDGQMLPPYDTHATLARVAALMDRLEPEIVVSLGDSFHDGGGPARMAARDRELLAGLIARCDWIWIEGNHDSKCAETIGGVARATVQIGALMLRHEPTSGAAPGEIAGHLHPCATVAGRGRSVRRRCFAFDGARLVMPAFGAYTGGLNICDEAFEPLFPDGATAFVLGRRPRAARAVGTFAGRLDSPQHGRQRNEQARNHYAARQHAPQQRIPGRRAGVARCDDPRHIARRTGPRTPTLRRAPAVWRSRKTPEPSPPVREAR